MRDLKVEQRLRRFEDIYPSAKPIRLVDYSPRTLLAQFSIQARDPHHADGDTFKTTQLLKHTTDFANPEPWNSNIEFDILDWKVNLEFWFDCQVSQYEFFDLGKRTIVGLSAGYSWGSKILAGPQSTNFSADIGVAIAADTVEFAGCKAHYTFEFPGDEFVFISGDFGYRR